MVRGKCLKQLCNSKECVGLLIAKFVMYNTNVMYKDNKYNNNNQLPIWTCEAKLLNTLHICDCNLLAEDI